jgi:hypothetical protein
LLALSAERAGKIVVQHHSERVEQVLHEIDNK